MSEETIQFIINIGIALVIGVVGIALAIIVKRLLNDLLKRFTHATWTIFVADLVQIGIIAVTIYFLLDRTGAAGIIVVIITAATAAFAIGSQRVAGNFIAGFNLLAQNYYRVGDLVTIGGHQGIVTDITLSHTILKNTQRDRVIIPNADALDGVVVNHSQIPGLYIKVSIPVLRDHDRSQAIKIMGDCAAQYSPRMTDVPPDVYLEDFGGETNVYGVRVTVAESDKLGSRAEGKLRLLVAEGLKANGITVGKLY